MTTRKLFAIVAALAVVLALGTCWVQKKMAEAELLVPATPSTHDAGKPACLCQPGDPLCACL